MESHAAPPAPAQPAIAIPGGYLGALSLGVDNPALHTMSGLAASLMCFGGIAGLSSQVRWMMGGVGPYLVLGWGGQVSSGDPS